ncbi:hypothetical protein RHEC894_CH04075 [Rhizobium sp. CIAT894]|nr:hypothetical protein [Rhizobium sp. CIAT894]ARM90315.1 hypothetical protein RHEC894_CH04075 [Rhizobium sp. CIAT894]
MQSILEFLGLMAVFSIVIPYSFTDKAIRDRFIANGKWFNRITGAALLGFGFRLAPPRAAD